MTVAHATAVLESLVPAGRWDFTLRHPDVDSFLRLNARKWQPVGSRYTCSPPPMNTDEDWLVFLKDVATHLNLEIMGFTAEGDDRYGDMENFRSYRRDDLNLIVTVKSDFYHSFLVATETAKRFNLLRKHDRIALFRAVLYQEIYDGPIPDCDKCENAGWVQTYSHRPPAFAQCDACHNPRGIRCP